MVSTNQKTGLGLARGFIVLIMPAVHSVWLYSSTEVKEGWLGMLLSVLAEGPGAQLFMFLMGVFIVLSRPKTVRQIIIRSLVILLLGYMLNFFKLVIPYCSGWIPAQFFIDNDLKTNSGTPLQLFLIGDILQFAGIAYPVCSLIMRLKHSKTAIGLLIAIILLASPFIWDLTPVNLTGSQMVALLNGKPPFVFFPVFPWLVYPLLGLLGGAIIKRFGNKKAIVFFCIASTSMIGVGLFLQLYEPVEWNQTFYRLGPGGTITHGGIVLGWLAVFLYLPEITQENRFFSLLKWLSNNITTIYLLQWIVIMWLLPFFGYSRLGISQSIGALIVTSFISFLIPFFIQYYIRKN